MSAELLQPQTILSRPEVSPSAQILLCMFVKPGDETGEIIPFRSFQEILESGMRGQASEKVNLTSIIQEDGITEKDHVDKLAKSMLLPWGQINRVVLAAEVKDGQRSCRVIDGFHRTEGLRLNHYQTIKAEVMYGLTEEEVYDLRILAANSVRSVQFARVAMWMEKAYAETLWSKRGFTLVQVFSLANNNTPGKKLGLTPSEATEMKAWALTKAELWHRTVSTILQERILIDKADPDLVKMVRTEAGGGKEGSGVLNPARLKSIVEELPGQKNFELQQSLVALQRDKNFDALQLRAVAKALAGAQNEVRVNDILKNPESVYGFKRKTVAAEHFPEPTEFSDTYNEPVTVASLQRRIGELEIALANSNHKDTGGLYWWKSFGGITGQERSVLDGLFEQFLPLEDVARKNTMTQNKALSLVGSAIRRYQLFLQGNIKEQGNVS